MVRIITIVSDGKTPIIQQNMSSGYSANKSISMMDLIADLQVFVGLMEEAYRNTTTIENAEETPVQEIARCKKEIDKLLERINQLKT